MSGIYVPKINVKPKFVSMHIELVKDYLDMLREYKYSHGIKHNINYNKNYVIGDTTIPVNSNCIYFMVASNSSVLYECALVITEKNLIYFLCTSDEYKAIRKLYSATSVLRLIYYLRLNDNIEFD